MLIPFNSIINRNSNNLILDYQQSVCGRVFLSAISSVNHVDQCYNPSTRKWCFETIELFCSIKFIIYTLVSTIVLFNTICSVDFCCCWFRIRSLVAFTDISFNAPFSLEFSNRLEWQCDSCHCWVSNKFQISDVNIL